MVIQLKYELPLNESMLLCFYLLQTILKNFTIQIDRRPAHLYFGFNIIYYKNLKIKVSSKHFFLNFCLPKIKIKVFR